MKKKILFLTGFGLNQDLQLKNLLEARGFMIDFLDFDFLDFIPTLSTYHSVFCMGPMSEAISDKLLAGKYALLLKKNFESQNPSKITDTQFFGFGMGALIYIGSGLWPSSSLQGLKLKSVKGSGAWRNVTLSSQDTKQILGLELCEIPWDPESKIFEGAPAWMHSGDAKAGWTLGTNLVVSDINPLSVKEASLLPEYGYFDSSTISPVDDFLDKIIK